MLFILRKRNKMIWLAERKKEQTRIDTNGQMQPEQNGHEHDGGQYRPRSGSGLSGKNKSDWGERSTKKVEFRLIF